MPEKTPISIQKIQDDDVKKAVFSALEQINAKKLIHKENMKILLKPNLLSANPPERAVTTHPKILRAVIQWLKRFENVEIIVAESSGGQNPNNTERAMKISGLQEVCESEGIQCVPFEKTERKMYKIENPIVFEGFPGSVLLDKVDLIINLPKIKTHAQCLLTCCIKNMFGTLILAHKPKTHIEYPTLKKFSAALADIYSVFKPQLTIVDGYLCQEGNGPAAGKVVNMNIVLAGFDGVALDSTICDIVGFGINEIPYINFAESKGCGTSDKQKIEILGESIESVKRKFKRPITAPVSAPVPKFLAKYIGKTLFQAQVKFNPEKCKLCSTCWTNCPADAITPPKRMKKGEIPIWDKKKCITCYCCAELCPYEAVEIKIPLFRNFLKSWVGIGITGIIFLAVVFSIIF